MRRSGVSWWRGCIAALCVVLAITFALGSSFAAPQLDDLHRVDAALSAHGQFVHAHPEEPHQADDHARIDGADDDAVFTGERQSSDEAGCEPHVHYSATPQVGSIPGGETSIRVARAALNLRFSFDTPFRISQVIFGLDRPPKNLAVL